jgi:hypothetical protein
MLFPLRFSVVRFVLPMASAVAVLSIPSGVSPGYFDPE